VGQAARQNQRVAFRQRAMQRRDNAHAESWINEEAVLR
jgi:hypothetical protein